MLLEPEVRSPVGVFRMEGRSSLGKMGPVGEEGGDGLMHGLAGRVRFGECSGECLLLRVSDGVIFLKKNYIFFNSH